MLHRWRGDYEEVGRYYLGRRYYCQAASRAMQCGRCDDDVHEREGWRAEAGRGGEAVN